MTCPRNLSSVALLPALFVGVFVATPFFIAVRFPIDGVGLLIALDVIPDLFKTLINVTGHMAATVLLSRYQHSLDSA